jgi:hypothetical protein
MERSTRNSDAIVRFKSDDESAHGSQSSRGEVMESGVRNAARLSLHTITIITLLDSKQCRVAAKALLDQCCTDKGLIS